MISDTRAIDPKMDAVIEQDAAKIGITFKVHTINGAYPTIQTPSKNIPFAERPGWGKDYADPYTFFGELFDGRAIIPSGNTNYALVGITAGTVQGAQGDGRLRPLQCRYRPRSSERRLAARQVRCPLEPAASQLLREPRQVPDDEGRAVGSVPVART